MEALGDAVLTIVPLPGPDDERELFLEKVSFIRQYEGELREQLAERQKAVAGHD